MGTDAIGIALLIWTLAVEGVWWYLLAKLALWTDSPRAVSLLRPLWQFVVQTLERRIV